jgi:hypothetical protein
VPLTVTGRALLVSSDAVAAAAPWKSRCHLRNRTRRCRRRERPRRRRHRKSSHRCRERPHRYHHRKSSHRCRERPHRYHHRKSSHRRCVNPNRHRQRTVLEAEMWVAICSAGLHACWVDEWHLRVNTTQFYGPIHFRRTAFHKINPK